jgi:heat-inducible transcriptional repressor
VPAVPTSAERRFDVLRAIVEDFVATHEPVGSRAIVERHVLGVSPATVRNDMAVLEEQGLITQPHTSAGRIPTDLGYRAFVDGLDDVKPLSSAERRAITTFLDGAADVDDVVQRSVRLLAQMTQKVAVVQWPTIARTSVRRVELVRLAPRRILLVMITDAGRVEQRQVELPTDITDDVASELGRVVSGALEGVALTDVAPQLLEAQDTCRPELRASLVPVVASLLEASLERPDERIAIAGMAHLSRHQGDFTASLGDVLEALEEQVVLLRLLGEMSLPDGGVAVRIGQETASPGLTTASLVASSYSGSSALGVVGPTRMDYPQTMGAVFAVARYVGRVLQTG